MDANFISSIASLGVGAVFGIIVFIIYRTDRKSSEARFDQLYGGTEKRLETLLERDSQSREENTKALQELTTLVMRLNGHHT